MSFDFSKVFGNTEDVKEEVVEEQQVEEVVENEEIEESVENEEIKEETTTKKTTKKEKKETKKDKKETSKFKVTRDRPVMAYGELVYVEKDTTKTLDDIKKTLIDKYGFSEFDDKSCELEYNLSTGEVVPKITFQRKG